MRDTIDKGTCTAEHPAPLLFIHGAWHGAWCWDDHFLDWFADNGYRAVAVNLPAHGGRAGTKALHRHSVADYLDAVMAAADELPTPPVLVGHSLGGLLTQKYLEARQAPAAVLIASVPPTGIVPFLLRWIRQYPALFARTMVTWNTLRVLEAPDRTRAKMLSPFTPDDVVAACAARLQNESMLTTPGAMFGLPKPKRIATPILVLGAELDDCFTVDEVHATAAAYGTDAVVFPDMGHDMMLEPGWRDVAERIDGWLLDQGL